MRHQDQPRGRQSRAPEGELLAKKKTLHADERERPDVVQRRDAFRAEQPKLDPATLVFVDEFGINVDMTRRYARSPRGMRAVGSIPLRTGGNITLVFGLRGSEILAPRMLLGGMSKEKFTFYAETMLGPTLRPGDRVILDNLAAHLATEVTQAFAQHGASVTPLPPYSPDMTPIENCGSKIKASLKAKAARTLDGLAEALVEAIERVTPADIFGWLKHAGYCPRLE